MGLRCVILMTLVCVGCPSAAFAAEDAERAPVVFAIPTQPMASALQQWASQAQRQILFRADVVNPFEAGVHGRMRPFEALDALLKDTFLEYRREGDVVIIRDASAETQSSPPRDVETPAPQLGETVVTGTLIRGVPTASPLLVIERADIERSGYRTTHEFMQSLTQTFGGGDNEGAVASPGGSALNIALGSSVNLRGLGSDSTLVLIDGHRVAPAAFGQFVDVSLIPLEIIERIEILTDGASATYGSDAIAGAVNFILRRDQTGAETRLQGGGTPQGGVEEYLASQSFGIERSAGRASVLYDFYQRSNLVAAERRYAADLGEGFDLLPSHRTHSLVAVADRAFTERSRGHATALISQRDTEWHVFNALSGDPARYPASTRQVHAVAVLDTKLSRDWMAHLYGAHSSSDTARDVATRGWHQAAERNQLALTTLGAHFEGGLLEAPAGWVRLAVGATVRRERFQREGQYGFSAERTVAAAFAEGSVPILDTLAMSLASRYEDSSDFGGTTTPKLGLTWSPLRSLRLRGSYGESFRAPALNELDEYNVSAFVLDVPDPQAVHGMTRTLLVSGHNADLEPERARTWTVGLDMQYSFERPLDLAVTYFDTRVRERIVAPLPGREVLWIFAQEPVYGALIERDPDPATVPEGVSAIIDRRLQNLSTTHVRGFDLRTTATLVAGLDDWSLQVDATYLVDYVNVVTPEAAGDVVLDTAYHPVDLRARAGLVWQRGAWSISGFLNYVDGFTNDTQTPAVTVEAWSTLDLRLTYEPLARDLWWDQTRIALSVTNALDAAPPFLSSPVAQYQRGFDPTNASALGRFVSLAVSKTW